MSESPLHTPRVMIVEDDEFIREILMDFLLEEGVQAEAFENGKLALTQLNRDYGYDLIFLDMQMPVMDGREFMKEFKKLPEKMQTMPVYLFSANSKDELYKELGCTGYAKKPIDLLTIRQIVNSVRPA